MELIKAFAAQSKSDKLNSFEITRRNLKDNDVKIEILYCGVCHSDIHQVRNEWDNATYPMVPGHEIVGKVLAVGSNVKKFKVGDIVGVGVIVDSCQNCKNCKKGLEQYCDNGAVETYNSLEYDKKTITYGGYSKQIVTREEFVLRISESLPLANVAPLLCAGITTYSPLKHWNINHNHKVGVIGLGGLGHMAVKFAVSFGADVTVLSTSKSKENDAKKLGAQHFAYTKNENELESLSDTFDFIIDTVSAPHDYNMYLKMLTTNGHLICVGIPPTPMEIYGVNLIAGRKSISGSGIGGMQETQEMLDYCAQHNITSDVEIINIHDVNEAYERVLKGDVKYRFVIDMATL